MTSSIQGHVLITGAGSGIGHATAIAFAQAGFHLVLVGRSIAKLEAVAAKAQSFGVTAQAVSIDLAEVETVKAKLQAIDAPIDVLINNAGMGYTNTLLDTSLEDWQQVMTLNLTSVFQCIQAFLPQMRDRKRGTIVNIASIAAANAFPGWGAYSVSKAALVALSKTLAVEERSHGIRVVSISPGSVNTPIWDTDTVQADFDRAQMLTPEMVAQTILHTVLLPAQAVIEDLTIAPSAGAL
ncbi:SDR family oxidoreductase [Microcoleus sp. FACHB-1515]|uniref:SDR family oxidoreductase n=1 Tax=Cyanophyceae TaxID=3028117 RepID=UPI001681E867|nr:SDR family oxidoreductase [Microcoleus sp. FACHB-1515]MBD2090566.1 SDR family oxidoreductase [Microcoleus sp. FACHB-1515]